MQSKKTRKKIIFIVIALSLLAIIFYATWFEPKTLQTSTSTIPFSQLPESWNNVKIVYFSDLIVTTTEQTDNLVTKINEQNPDLIIYTGNFLSDQTAAIDYTKISEAFKKLKAPLGKIAVPSNTDMSNTAENVVSLLEAADFSVLINKQQYMYNRSKEPLNFIAMNTAITKEEQQLLFATSHDVSSLLISTDPDIFDTVNRNYSNVKLTLAGDTFGGHIGIPFLNKLLANQHQYANGIYHQDDQTLLVSRGVGTPSNFHFRLLSAPTIYVITLKTTT